MKFGVFIQPIFVSYTVVHFRISVNCLLVWEFGLALLYYTLLNM